MDTENCHVCNADTPYPSVSHESVPSLIDNLTYALYGIITKTVLNGRVQWTIPCDPNSTGSIWGYTRNAGEGLMCYMLRVLQSTAPGLPPIGVNGQVLVSLGGNAVEWRDSVVSQATTTFMGGFKLASTNSDVSILTGSILALSPTGVAAGTFGSPTQFPILTVDSKGRITSASAQAIAIASSQINGISASQVGAGLTSAQISSISSAAIPASGVSAGSFGSSTQLPVLTVDSTGRITGATTIPHIVGNNASDLTTGTLNSARLPALTGDVSLPAGTSVTALATTGVSAGTFGSSTQLPVLTVDTKGRITSIATSQIAVNANNITSGTISALRLPAFTGDVLVAAGTSVAALQTTGVSAGTFGSSAQIPVLTVDTKGRITVAGSTPVLPGNNASDLTTGTLNPARLATSGVAAGSFGSSTQIPVLTVDSKGRITTATTVTVRAGDNASDLTTGTLDPDRLATSGVSAGTFGSGSTIAQFTVDSKGRITNALEVGISGTAGGTVVAVGAESNTLVVSGSPVIYSGALQVELATTGVPAITAGSSAQSAVITVDAFGRVTALETAPIVSLTPSGVVSGSYGHPERVAQFTVNSNGIITGATEAAIAISAASVSGLAASATTDTTNAGNIITGTLSTARIPVLASSQIPVLASSQISGISAAQVGVGLTSAQIDTLPSSKISGLAASATTDTTNASNISSGTLNAARVGTGIQAGQISSVAAAQVTGLAPSATTDTTNANNITSGTLAANRVGFGITAAQISTVAAGQVTGLAPSATTDTTNASNIQSGLLLPARISTGITAAQISSLAISQVSGLGTGVGTFLQAPTSANFASAITDETGSAGNVVFSNNPTLASATISNLTIVGYTESVVAVGTVGATATLAITAGTVLTATLTSATPCSFTMPAVGAGKSFTLYLKQPATGTATTASFSPVTWPNAVAPTITATLGRMDIISFISDGARWYGNITQNFIY